MGSGENLRSILCEESSEGEQVRVEAQSWYSSLEDLKRLDQRPRDYRKEVREVDSQDLDGLFGAFQGAWSGTLEFVGSERTLIIGLIGDERYCATLKVGEEFCERVGTRPPGAISRGIRRC